MTEPLRLTVTADLAGERADRIVAQLAGVSRSIAKRLCDRGEVTVESGSVRPSERLTAGTALSVQVPETDVLAPKAIAFGVLYEDDDVVVIDKPAGLVVHPGAGHYDDTLVSGLLHRYPETSQLAADQRWGLVHRLDRGTSGALLVARNPAAHSFLQEQLRLRKIERRYLALVAGTPESATGTIDAPLDRDPHRPTRRAVVQGGRPARTHYRRLARWPDVTLLELTLETGRTHQIRVHCASIGNPVLGDRTYGRALNHPGEPGRIWLHAESLGFTHPDGKRHVVASPLPDRLRASLGRLGPPAAGTIPSFATE